MKCYDNETRVKDISIGRRAVRCAMGGHGCGKLMYEISRYFQLNMSIASVVAVQ